MIPLLGFMPDADPTVSGAILDCENLIPTAKGFSAANSLADTGTQVLPGECRGAGLAVLLTNARRLFAGTPTAIYENISGEWADVSRDGGYSSGAENRWRFAQFGNVTLAVNQQDVMQASASGAFADIDGAPKVRIIEVVAGFVMALATTDTINGDEPDRWWCSGLYDHTAWAPSQATQAATARFIDSPGEIRAGRKLGNTMVVYKENSMYIGEYVGPPVIWAWQQVPGEIGASSQEAVVSIGTAHLFFGADDFWIFDGSRPVPIGAPIRDWFLEHSNPKYRYRIQGYYDRLAAVVYWHYASSDSIGELDACLAYNVKTQRWGKVTRPISAFVEYAAPGVTYDTLGNLYETYDDIADIPYDSPQWFYQKPVPAVMTPDGYLMLATGTPERSSITINDIGDDTQYTTLRGVIPRFLKTPLLGSLHAYYKAGEGDALEPGEVAELFDGRFDFMWSARWHRVTMQYQGAMETNGFDVDLVVDGSR
ncbi:hypothetical protein [Allopusillimonas ginsengisoli]|uniref:hypothetical protein n=1 Tax=Allopusillimonas ginsengisoli TaxID=453575 RepID=UPI0010229F86|nr:hypothetical protein [Allopusillimonas ginsengisoli]TEA78641.1 hypothetical protein ERE07_09600 [Allopusillimonas ginsengisoli]